MSLTNEIIAKHGGPLLSPQEVCEEYFAPMALRTFMRKLTRGEIALPLVRMAPGNKSPRKIHAADLAAYIEKRRKVAAGEMKAMAGGENG